MPLKVLIPYSGITGLYTLPKTNPEKEGGKKKKVARADSTGE